MLRWCLSLKFDAMKMACQLCMPKRSSKGRKDLNVLATRIVAQATGDAPPADEGKNPAAVALDRLGGLKGGKARAKKLSAKRLSEIARTAARIRWKERKP